MGTVVAMQVLGSGAEVDAGLERAFGWFFEVEARCTRFDENSELMQLCSRVGAPVQASAILFQAVQFAMMVAEESGGAFDPTVGRQMCARGFDRDYRTGKQSPSAEDADGGTAFHHVELDPDGSTITLLRPLTLDLGAVAKGLAVDLAARELQMFRNFAIDAGGDLYLGGLNAQEEPWAVGIRDPRHSDRFIDTVRVSNQAVCTSGDYERGHHILDPRTGTPVNYVASVTVVAQQAMLADALGTAAFAMGPRAGIEFLDRMGVAGLIVTPELCRYETRGLLSAA
jgi:FAD:protein FMN transferase